jgi:hypothetical protein
MIERDLPLRGRGLQGVFEPERLGLVKVGRVEHEEIDQPVPLAHGVIVLPRHVEERVADLVLPPVLDVVVPEHGVKVHLVIYQLGEGLLELLAEIAPAAVRVDVVARREHEIEGGLRVRVDHRLRQPRLLVAAGPPVSDDGETDLAFDRLDPEYRRGLYQGARRGRGHGYDCLTPGNQIALIISHLISPHP